MRGASVLSVSWLPVVVGLISLGCHSDSYGAQVPDTNGPFSSAADLQLTYSVEQNYWPTWSQDGKSILYAYVDQEFPQHRCLGMLPAAGGTRIWQLCDNRSNRSDSISSYGAFALDTAGRLLVAEALNRATGDLSPRPTIVLWLADTAHPFVRTKLLTLPQQVPQMTITWLSEIQWTSTTTFMALGQEFNSLPQCTPSPLCPGRDSTFADGGIVVSGTITGSTAALHAIAGTDSATSYSLAENGSSVVFTVPRNVQLFRVPVGGGVPAPLPINRSVPDSVWLQQGELTGVTCKGTTCIEAWNDLLLTDQYTARGVDGCAIPPVCFFFAQFRATLGPRAQRLIAITLGSTATQVIASGDSLTPIFASPKYSPISNDLLYQRGGVWGHLQTYQSSRGNGVLHVLRAGQ